MEENEKVEETVVEETTTSVGGALKDKKKLIIIIVAALVAIFVVYNVFFNFKGKAKSTINTFCESMGKGKYVKAYKQLDAAGVYTFRKLDKDDYEDFWSEYKEFKKSDDWEDAEEEWKEKLEDIKEEEKDFDKEDAVKVKVKKITKFKKLGKNFYEVKAKIETKDDDDTNTDTMTFYVMKDGLGCKIVGGDI